MSVHCTECRYGISTIPYQPSTGMGLGTGIGTRILALECWRGYQAHRHASEGQRSGFSFDVFLLSLYDFTGFYFFLGFLVEAGCQNNGFGN